MSKRYEDFDEWSDPENPRDVPIHSIHQACDMVKPFVIRTPCINSRHEQDFTMRLYFKMDSFQKTGSFKERGAVNILHNLKMDDKKIGVVIASDGNFALSFCFHASRMTVPVTVVMPSTTPLWYLKKCHSYGSKVIVHGHNLAEAQKQAQTIAKEKTLNYINGRDHPLVLAGYGSMLMEVLDEVPSLDAVIVPVGTGGLLAATITTIKHHKPDCLVYGVSPENNCAYFKSIEANEMVNISKMDTMASSTATTFVGPNSFYVSHHTVDKMLLVKEDWIARAMLHMFEEERCIVEGAAACSLAAIIGHLVPELKKKTVVCLMTGGNIDNLDYNHCLDRGRAAKGLLLKFRVSIVDTTAALTQLMNLIKLGDYNVVRLMKEHPLVDRNNHNYIDVRLVVESFSLAESLELKRIVERAYPDRCVFENEPFSDKRTCPCYAWKPICDYS